VTEQSHEEETEQEATSGRGWFWLALAVLIGICAFAVYRSALFRLGALDVTGLQHLTEARIADAAGLVPGAARWQHPASAIEARLTQEPWIKSAKVSWVWNHLQVQIQERKPVGLIHYTDRYYLLLDETGMILGQTELDPKAGLPVIAQKELTKALRGQRLDEPGLLDALLLLSRMDDPLRQQVSEVKVAANRSLTLFMVPGATVEWGQLPSDGDRVAAVESKLTYFLGTWNQLNKRAGACQIDMRVWDDRATATVTNGCN
jgi:cell division septal protein FtsQ